MENKCCSNHNIRPSTSPEIDKIGEALSQARVEFKNLENNRKANYGGYADLKAIYYATVDACAKYKIGVSHFRSQLDKETIVCSTRIMHAGQWIEDYCYLNITGDGKKSIDQLVGSSQSYNKRYALYNLLGIISTNDKDDNDYQDYEYKEEYQPVKNIEKINKDQEKIIRDEVGDDETIVKKIFETLNINNLANIPSGQYEKCLNFIRRNKAIK